jgi:hypothetical protein
MSDTSPDYAVLMAMVNSHEERIQRLEGVTSELAASAAETNATMKAFSQQMRMMSDSVVAKLDDVSNRLTEKMAQNEKDRRLAAFETKNIQTEKIGEKWEDFARNILYFVLTSGGGAIAALIAEHFFGRH